MPLLNRRDFIKISSVLAGTAWLTTLTGCEDVTLERPLNQTSIQFNHGVASGDPQHDRLIVWTRVTPATPVTKVYLLLEVALDANFSEQVRRFAVTAEAAADYCCKVDVTGLVAGQRYFYRFADSNVQSPTGQGKTLATGDLTQLSLAVVSCSNYPAGYFHVYDAIAKHSGLDAVLHLGDYIYEYAADGYASENAKALGRTLASNNDKELLSLDDYRRRYALYRQDKALQAAHQAHSFIAVWDDHELANDSYIDGAENHQANEGEFSKRKAAAIQAYLEWMPIRPLLMDGKPLYRHFHFGNLVSLYMLDTRLQARSKPLEYSDFMTGNGFAAQSFMQAMRDPNQQLIGMTQLQWLQSEMLVSNAKWQVLGQQILMARMQLPAELISSLAAPSANLFKQLAELGQLKQKPVAELTPQQQQRLAQVLPYNLDAWDGYPLERERLYAMVRSQKKNIVVLAGDTHNAWSSTLKDAAGQTVGVELATASVSSPGLEKYLGLTTPQAAQLAGLLPVLIDELEYCNLHQRGFLVLTFTPSHCLADWQFVDNINQPSYTLSSGHQRLLKA
jgi:alkaline phosphatase D